MQPKLTIQERLKDLRVERSLTLEQLSAETGISKSALGKYEADDFKDISPFSMVELAKFYGVSTDYLLGLTEQKNHPNTELDALHLGDDAIEVLRTGKFNHRLLSELICHKDFQRFMLDAEIYDVVPDKAVLVVDGRKLDEKAFTLNADEWAALPGTAFPYSGSIGGGYTYYTIKATAGVNGSISPTGNVSVREGRDQTFTITPDKGYVVANVKIDGRSIGAVKSYTFENVKRAHTIEVSFTRANEFIDVPAGSYYYDAVLWAVENGITTGASASRFDPTGICTRAQAVTFLWRAAGSPAAKSAVMPFADVKVGSYYYDAVLWAVENGITKGTSETMFSPDATCSRAQIVTFLWRSQKSPAAGTANPFTDVKASAYYADAVLWAVKEDVTKGTTNTTFSPDANCTRAQIVTFIWRCKK